MDARPLGIDIGYFSGKASEYNWAKLPAEVRFVLPGLGWGTWADPDGPTFVAGIEGAHRFWASWFFPYAHLAPRDQVAAWLKQPRPVHFPIFVDYERSREYGTIPSASHLLECWKRLEDATGEAAGGYSRKNLIDTNLATMSTEDLNLRWWWLAAYGSPGVEATTFALPLRIKKERVLFHQTSDTVPPFPGFLTHRPPPDHLDRDRYVGVMPIDQFAGAPNPPVPLPLEDRVARLEEEALAHDWVLS